MRDFKYGFSIYPELISKFLLNFFQHNMKPASLNRTLKTTLSLNICLLAFQIRLLKVFDGETLPAKAAEDHRD